MSLLTARRLPLAGGLTLLLLGAGGCGPTMADLQARQKAVNSLEHQLKQSKRHAKWTQKHADRLKKGGQPAKGDRWIEIPKDQLRKLAKAYLPYTVPGSSIHEKLRGEFTLNKPRDFKIDSRGRIHVKVTLTGKKVSVKQKGFADHKRKIKEALKKGVDLDLIVYLNPDKTKGTITLYGRVTKVKLKKHDNPDYRSYIKNAINSTAFKQAKGIPVPKTLRGKGLWLATSGKHLIVGR